MARPRKPTHLKVVSGTAQPCRTNKKEPKPKRGVPPAPKHLSKVAQAAWKEFAGILDRTGVLTVSDGAALASACEAYADLREARASLARPMTMLNMDAQPVEIAAAGSITYVTVGKAGPMIRSRPEMALIADADRRLMAWLTKLGMTPADRSRVSAQETEEVSPWDDLAA